MNTQNEVKRLCLLLFSMDLSIISVVGIPNHDKSLGFIGAISYFGLLVGMFLMGIAFSLLVFGKKGD